MKLRTFVILVFAAVSLVPFAAFADTSTADEAGIHHLKPITIVGRPNKPSVVIELTRPTAAAAARAAHEEFHAALIESLQPATLTPSKN
jgi:hypothetical protein